MRFRAALPDDLEAVHALLVERDIAEIGAPDMPVEDLRDQWRGSEFDLRADTRIAEVEGGGIVAYAVVAAPGTMVVVDPEHQGQGIGTRLLHWSEQRDRERGRERHCQWIAASNDRARELLLAAGYRLERSYYRLVRRLDEVGGAAAPPPGIALRPVDVERDAAALHGLHQASFAANADYRRSSLAAFREAHLQVHDFAAELSCVAVCGDRPVGFLLAWWWREANLGFVDMLATHPDHRSRGLATAMLETAFAGFAAVGVDEVQLGVASDNAGALRLYKRCGMTERFRYDTYERSAVESV